MKKLVIFTSVVILFTSIAPSAVHPSAANRLTEISELFIAYTNDNEFHAAANLFHYPAQYSPQELKSDKAAVSKSLSFFYKELGSINSPKLNREPAQVIGLFVGGGDIPYWKSHPKFVSLLYKVKFQNDGDGFVEFKFCKIAATWEIQNVKYGFSVEKNGVRDRLGEIFHKFNQDLHNKDSKLNKI